MKATGFSLVAAFMQPHVYGFIHNIAPHSAKLAFSNVRKCDLFCAKIINDIVTCLYWSKRKHIF